MRRQGLSKEDNYKATTTMRGWGNNFEAPMMRTRGQQGEDDKDKMRTRQRGRGNESEANINCL